MSRYMFLVGAGLMFSSLLAKGLVTIAKQQKNRAKILNFHSGKGLMYQGKWDEPFMTRREAALILGVSEFAKEAEIGKQYKKVMMLNHPDRGGSLFIATKVNQAKDTLLVK